MTAQRRRAASLTDRVDDALARFVGSSGDPTDGAPPVPDGEVRPLLVRPALLGLAATVVVVACATHRGALFRGRSLLNWPWQAPWVSEPGNLRKWVAIAGFYGGIAVLGVAWVWVSRVVRRGGVRMRVVMAIFALWSLPVLVGPPLLSRDVYVYGATGEVVNHGLNPNSRPVSALGNTPFFQATHPVWRHTPSPYGPLHLRSAAWAVRLAGHNVNWSVVVLRTLQLVGVLVAAAYLPRLCHRLGRDPADAAVLVLCNPVTLLDVIGGAHNEGLMMGFLVAGLALGLTGHRLWGIVICGVGTAVKFPVFGGVVALGWDGAGEDVPLRRRLLPLAVAGTIGLAALAAVTAAVRLDWSWLGALDIPQRGTGFLAPFNALGFAIARFAGADPLDVIPFTRAVGMAVMLGVAALLFWRSRVFGAVRALGCFLFLFAVLGPQMYPWYLSWGITVLGIAGPRRLRTAFLALSVVINFGISPVGGGLLDDFPGLTKVLVALGVVAAWAVFARVTAEQCREPREERAQPSETCDDPIGLAPAVRSGG